jgi:hypothetical protein
MFHPRLSRLPLLRKHGEVQRALTAAESRLAAQVLFFLSFFLSFRQVFELSMAA